ncbi:MULTISPECIES: hypothetical protein [Streptomyces]|uniref:hypothetical protein n=1 Tax=Streptomyces TaxID=1883 RepID=UPI00345C531F
MPLLGPSNAERIAALRQVLDERRNVITAYPDGHPAKDLYIKETAAIAREIERLSTSGTSRLPSGKGLGVVAVLVGLGMSWLGQSSGSHASTWAGSSLVAIGCLLVILGRTPR